MSTPAPSPSAFGSRPVLSAARAAAARLTAATGEASRLWALSDAEVGAALDVLHEVRRAAEAQQVAVVVEARSRGLGTLAGLGPVDWAIQAAPGMSTGHAATLQAVATACEDPGSPTSPRPSSPARCRSARPPSSPASAATRGVADLSSQPTRPSSSPTRRT